MRALARMEPNMKAEHEGMRILNLSRSHKKRASSALSFDRRKYKKIKGASSRFGFYWLNYFQILPLINEMSIKSFKNGFHVI